MDDLKKGNFILHDDVVWEITGQGGANFMLVNLKTNKVDMKHRAFIRRWIRDGATIVPKEKANSIKVLYS